MGAIEEFKERNTKDGKFKDFDHDISKMGNGKRVFQEEK